MFLSSLSYVTWISRTASAGSLHGNLYTNEHPLEFIFGARPEERTPPWEDDPRKGGPRDMSDDERPNGRISVLGFCPKHPWFNRKPRVHTETQWGHLCNIQWDTSNHRAFRREVSFSFHFKSTENVKNSLEDVSLEDSTEMDQTLRFRVRGGR